MSGAIKRWIVLGLVALSLAGGAQVQRQRVAPPEHVRGIEQTLLTFPEWFLVFSPYEYGEFLRDRHPADFPFYGHIRQFWQSYRAVYDETRRRHLDLNPGYHLMIIVIGTSTTVEYALKSAYESLVGRLAEGTALPPTEEEKYAAAVAQDYVRFIRVRPWYEYDFGARLKGLWRDTSWSGPDLLRKWERKYILTSEYLVKWGYAKLIKIGTKSVYDTPLLVTSVVTTALPAASADMPELHVLQALGDGRALVTVPRYEAFMTYARALAMQGLDFQEIAGNSSFILVSVLAPDAWHADEPGAVLIEQPILTRPGTRRVLLAVAVDRLAAQLRDWKARGVAVEHIFDY
jgi:hypothetical protein